MPVDIGTYHYTQLIENQ